MKIPLSMPSTFPVTCHTDFVGQGTIFVAIEGYVDNGIKYIKKAVEKGASCIVIDHNAVIEDELLDYIKVHNVVIERVVNTRKALAELSAQHAGFPAKNLNIIGITGTKGKTTTSFLLEHILAAAGYKTALISSVRNRIVGNEFTAPLTTPQPDYLQQFLQLCVNEKVEYVVMEVAAQALTLHRVEGILFCGLIFTNFSHEHLEFYQTLDNYFAAKSTIFTMVANNAPILINADDKHGVQLLTQHTSAQPYGFGEKIDGGYQGFYVSDPVYTIDVKVQHHKSEAHFTCSALFGSYNAYNIVAACSMALELGISPSTIQQGLTSFAGVPGRLQQHALPNGARAFIDYAHNPESFRVLLSTLRLLTDNLIVVFGAGGGRDKLKRPLMGAIAAEIADMVIITSDNPRLENPAVIAKEIQEGVADQLYYKVVCQLDREAAIMSAYSLSYDGSIIALLGKGPDEYQIIGTTKYYFSERKIIEQLL
jgi:UDP-N-acetylmuramoyl-L-alanyl-D-glutamate--2,6-diaminopimelate ligase